MLRNILRIVKRNDNNSTTKPKKIGWSERFFIFAAVMFLLGWASTGIMSSAKDLFNFGFTEELRRQEDPQQIQDSLIVPIDSLSNESSPQEISGVSLEQSIEVVNIAQSDSGNDANLIATPESEINNTQPQVSNPLNWGDWYCANCVAVPVRVKLTHYWPPLGGDNCWTFYDDYCYSPTKSTVPWEIVIEIAAACPVPWLGSVVEIPALERRYLCLDTGDKVVCKDGICVVDVLTDKIYPWDGLDFDAIVYYPKVWVEPAPTFTPAATPDQ